ncbi:hypothetical protein, partial [Spongiibacter sp.]
FAIDKWWCHCNTPPATASKGRAAPLNCRAAAPSTTTPPPCWDRTVMPC